MLDKRLNDKGKNWRHVFKVSIEIHTTMRSRTRQQCKNNNRCHDTPIVHACDDAQTVVFGVGHATAFRLAPLTPSLPGTSTSHTS